MGFAAVWDLAMLKLQVFALWDLVVWCLQCGMWQCGAFSSVGSGSVETCSVVSGSVGFAVWDLAGIHEKSVGPGLMGCGPPLVATATSPPKAIPITDTIELTVRLMSVLLTRSLGAAHI